MQTSCRCENWTNISLDSPAKSAVRPLCETDQHGLRQTGSWGHTTGDLCLSILSDIPLLSKWISTVGDSQNLVKPLTIQCSPTLRRGDGGGVSTRTFQSFFLPNWFCDFIHAPHLKPEEVLSAPKTLNDRISLLPLCSAISPVKPLPHTPDSGCV